VRVRPIHFVADLEGAVRFYEALGLEADARSRSGHWVELSAAAGELAVHGKAQAEDGAGREGFMLGFVADEPLEAVERRLLAAGFPPEGAIVDREWGRSLLVRGPDAQIVQIDEQDRELYT
jgi:catechol 2,3-dioxygenase-like lactoylglutathione lyase family enzyme